MEIIIKPVSQELLKDYFHFFENIAFADNPHWAGCYCYYYHFNGSNEEWFKRTKEENRHAAEILIKSGKMKGYLAFADGIPVGWCNVNDRENLVKITSNEEITQGKEEKICSIVCFIISPAHRRMGIASRILEQICGDYSGSGYEYIEAYPRKEASTNAEQYHGPMSMYMKAGFSVYRELSGYDIVRKKLG